MHVTANAWDWQGEGVITRGAEGVGTATVVWDSGVVQICYVGKGGAYWLKLCQEEGVR